MGWNHITEDLGYLAKDFGLYFVSHGSNLSWVVVRSETGSRNIHLGNRGYGLENGESRGRKIKLEAIIIYFTLL